MNISAVNPGRVSAKALDPDADISTEVAVTTYGIALGVGTAIAQLNASRQLSQVEADTVPVRRIAPVILLSIFALIVLSAYAPDS